MTSPRFRLLLLSVGLCAPLHCTMAVAAERGAVSTQLIVSGAVLHPGSFDLATLQALPAVTQAAGTSVYTGVSLWSFLSKTVGLKGDAAAMHPSLAMYVVATGSDDYRVVISLAELDPEFGNQPDLIAYALGGAGLGANGFARLVVPNDGKGGRSVSNLVSLDVFLAPASR
jgi:DMSO/TMAO reductase YedYZ molybdopterin-dependent catalytic subunit